MRRALTEMGSRDLTDMDAWLPEKTSELILMIVMPCPRIPGRRIVLLSIPSPVQGEEHGQFPMPNKGEVYSLAPRRCVDFGARMTPYPNVWGAPPFVSCLCLSTTGNAVSVISHSRHGQSCINYERATRFSSNRIERACK